MNTPNTSPIPVPSSTLSQPPPSWTMLASMTAETPARLSRPSDEMSMLPIRMTPTRPNDTINSGPPWRRIFIRLSSEIKRGFMMVKKITQITSAAGAMIRE